MDLIDEIKPNFDYCENKEENSKLRIGNFN